MNKEQRATLRMLVQDISGVIHPSVTVFGESVLSLLEQLDRCEEALKWYGEKYSYDKTCINAEGRPYSAIDIDCGYRARDALKEL